VKGILMKKTFSVSLAAMLMACGIGANSSGDAADAAAQRSRPKARPRQPVVDDMRFDRGGMAGCFDPNLSGYARRAAEEIGGVPCDEQPNRRAAGPATPSHQATWIIGEWGSGGDTCSLNGPIFEAGGGYYFSDERGRWSLAGNTLTLAVTHVSDDGGDSEYPLRQPRRMTVRVSPLPDGRMRWQEANTPARVFLRCRQIQTR
jgi:hypothetical protein